MLCLGLEFQGEDNTVGPLGERGRQVIYSTKECKDYEDSFTDAARLWKLVQLLMNPKMTETFFVLSTSEVIDQSGRESRQVPTLSLPPSPSPSPC